MRCPFCDGKFTLQGPYCPLCGRRIIGRDDSSLDEQPGPEREPQAVPSGHRPADIPRSSQPAMNDEVLVVDLEELPRPRPVLRQEGRPTPTPTGPVVAEPLRRKPVAGEYVGRSCPYCRFPLKARELMLICPACRVAHHADCWQENGGCTTYGCRFSPEAHPPQPVETTVPSASTPSSYPGSTLPRGLPSPAAAAAAAGLETAATNAFVLSVLGLLSFGLLGLVGAGVALSVLIRMRALGVGLASARGKAVGAIILGLGTAGFWVMAVLLWSQLMPGY